jgi:hypothetical protein
MKRAGVLGGGRLRHAHGYTSITLVSVVLAVTGLVTAGHGPVSTLLDLADGSAWLGNLKKGTATLVNGSAGRASATVGVGANGHRLRVTQTGEGVIVTDLDTGEVRRIDPTNLRVSQAVAYNAADLDVVQHGTTTYAVDHRRGRVIRLDPTTLRPIGDAVALPGPLSGNVVFDGAGVLWVSAQRSGAVYPIDNGRLGPPIDIGAAGATPLLSVTNGHPTVLVAMTRTLLILHGTRIARRFTVPEVAGGILLLPTEPVASVLPVVSAATGRLVTVDTGTGRQRSVPLNGRARGHDLGAPAVLTSRIYIPDYSTGSVIVYDTTVGRFARTIRATGRRGRFDAFVKGGYLWLNDQGSSRAVVVGPDGRPRPVDKYAGDVARPRAAPTGRYPRTHPGGPRPAPGVAGTGAPAPTPPPGGGRDSQKPTAPGVPSSVRTAPGDASVTASWVAPASGGSPIRFYVATAHPINGGPAVTRRTRRPIPSIAVSGLRNGEPYTLTVHAVNAVGRGGDSAPTAPVTPLPGQPQPPSVVSATADVAAVHITWQPSDARTLQPVRGYHVDLELLDGTLVSRTDIPDAQQTSTELSGLQRGTRYIVWVSAYTATAESGRTASRDFRFPTVPAAPVITDVVARNYRVTLSWSLPDDGDAHVDSYTVTVDGHHYATTANTRIDVGPRPGGRSFVFQVFAHNAVGGGPGSPPRQATPGSASYANWDHYQYPASIRARPTSASPRRGWLPVVQAGRDGEPVPVHCQEAGEDFRDPVAPVHSHIWNHINYHGIEGYVNDLYIHTPGTNSDRFSPGIPRC